MRQFSRLTAFTPLIYTHGTWLSSHPNSPSTGRASPYLAAVAEGVVNVASAGFAGSPNGILWRFAPLNDSGLRFHSMDKC